MFVFLNDRIFISGEQWVPGDLAEIRTVMNSFINSIHCLDFFPDFVTCYSGNGIELLLTNFKTIEEITDYSLSNPIQQIRQLLLSINSFNWDEQPKQKEDHLYFYQANLGATPHSVNKTTVAEATEYRFNDNRVLLLNLPISDFSASDPIHINRSKVTPPTGMTIVSVSTANEKTPLIQHLKEAEVNREYHWSEKHGENGSGVRHNKGEIVSPLLCSRQEADTILKAAVGYYKTDEMYGYDPKHEKFVVFKSEGELTPKRYHAYHPIDQGEVPEEVKTFLLSLR